MQLGARLKHTTSYGNKLPHTSSLGNKINNEKNIKNIIVSPTQQIIRHSLLEKR
jgi:hypothetical protein